MWPSDIPLKCNAKQDGLFYQHSAHNMLTSEKIIFIGWLEREELAVAEHEQSLLSQKDWLKNAGPIPNDELAHWLTLKLILWSPHFCVLRFTIAQACSRSLFCFVLPNICVCTLVLNTKFLFPPQLGLQPWLEFWEMTYLQLENSPI